MTSSHRLWRLKQEESTLTISPTKLCSFCPVLSSAQNWSWLVWGSFESSRPTVVIDHLAFDLWSKKGLIWTSHLRNAITWAERDVQRDCSRKTMTLIAFLTWQTVLESSKLSEGESVHDKSYDWSRLTSQDACWPSVTHCDVPQCFVTRPLRSPWHNRFVMSKCWQMLTSNFWSVLGNLFSFKILFDQAIVVPAWCTSIRSQPMSI